jgi:aspartyl-tRNA(Asn)/glutamyl-tRNA(Gln) amidotransferase subunit A
VTEPWTLDIEGCRRALAAKEISAEELCRSFLARIEATEPKVAACLSVLGDSALEKARALDAKGPDFSSMPLWGVPLTVKDVFCLKGAPTTAGSKILQNYHPAFEATVVQRLSAAGAVILAKTNCDEFAMGSSTEFSAYKPTKNPWNLERVPGGSSGGAAASVSARQAPGALGTDTGGSIRQPAALCGCVGLKPTYGRVSRYGIVAYASSFDQAGPLAANVSGCAAILQVIAGQDGKDSTCSAREVGDYLSLPDLSPSSITLGLPKELWEADFVPETAEVLSDGRKTLERAGFKLKEVSLPNLRFAVAAYYILASAEASTNLARYDGVRYGRRAGGEKDLEELYRASRDLGLGQEVKRRILLGTFVLSSGYYDAYFRKAAQVRRLIHDDYLRALGECHLLLAPVSSIPAWPFGAFTSDPLTIYQLDMMTLPLNLAGGPGLSLPAGLGKDGLPVGWQLMGRHFDEAFLLAVGQAVERLTPPLGRPAACP